MLKKVKGAATAAGSAIKAAGVVASGAVNSLASSAAAVATSENLTKAGQAAVAIAQLAGKGAMGAAVSVPAAMLKEYALTKAAKAFWKTLAIISIALNVMLLLGMVVYFVTK